MNKREKINEMMKERAFSPVMVKVRGFLYSLMLGGGVSLWIINSNPDWMRFFGVSMAVVGALNFAKMYLEVKEYAEKE